jgi:hypothetical protein
MIRLKSIERLEPARKQTTHCQLDGCSDWTREGKPYCTDHVTHHPYVQSLMAELERRESEEQAVAKRGARAVDIEGTAAQELVQHLRVHGKRTVRRLARELNRDLEIQAHYVEALRRRGLVRTTRTRRGATVVTLGGKSREAA